LSRRVALVIACNRISEAWSALKPISENADAALIDAELVDVDTAVEALARAEDSLKALIAAEVPTDIEVRNTISFAALFADGDMTMTPTGASPVMLWAHASGLVTKTETLVNGITKLYVWVLTPVGKRRVRDLIK